MIGFDNPDKFFKSDADNQIDQAVNFIKQMPDELKGAVMQNIQPILEQAQMIIQQQQGGMNAQGNEAAVSGMA